MNVLCAAGRRFGLWFYALWLFTGVSQLLGQSSPALIPIQFRVTDSNGVAAVDGPRTLSFRIYTNATGGAA